MPAALHTSLYAIYVETGNEDRCLLVHGYTAAMDLVSRNVVSFLREGGAVREDSASGGHQVKADTINLLKSRGYLTNLDSDEEREYVSGMVGFFHRAASRISSFLFLVAYDCNFTCPYCFEGGISGFGTRWSKRIMTKDLVDIAYRAMLEINPVRALHNNNITLFGGEPLLPENHDIVSYIVERGTRRGYVFTAVTNGYTLEHYADLLKPGMIQSLQISLDGNRDRHDRLRVHRTEGKTFERIMENIDMALRSGVSVCVRINTVGGGRDDLLDLYLEFIRRGWVRTGRFSAHRSRLKFASGLPHCDLHALPTEGKNVCTVPAVSDPDPPEVEGRRAIYRLDCAAGKESREDSYEADFEVRQKVRRFFGGESWALFRSDFCGARTGMVVFDPEGDMYACLESVGRREHRIGSYHDGLEMEDCELEKWREWESRDAECFTCKYLLFCGGGCAASSILGNDGAERCGNFQAVFRNAVAETYREFSRTRAVPVDGRVPG